MQPHPGQKRLFALPQVILHCEQLAELDLRECPEITEVLIWSDKLLTIDLTGGLGSCKLLLHESDQLGGGGGVSRQANVPCVHIAIATLYRLNSTC